MTVVVIGIAVVVAALAVVLVLRNRSAHNSVDSFRRQIDALGPEARRTVVDQVQEAAGRDAGESADAASSGAAPDEPNDEPNDGDGVRGS